MKKDISKTAKYQKWITELKHKFRQSQIKAALKVNSTLIEFYWELGADITERQKDAAWGSGFLNLVSKDLMAEFPDVKGFSFENMKKIRRWYQFYSGEDSNLGTTCSRITQMPYPELSQIPWGQNIIVVNKCEGTDEALFFVRKTIENNWSRAVLTNQIESGPYDRAGRSINNFKDHLPEPHSDLAQQVLKDPYSFDFLTMREKYDEKELELALVDNITQFLLELGSGFSYVGRQYKLSVDDEDFYIDLLFYHIKLRSYVVIELKSGKFKPEYAGKLNFYISAVDDILATEHENPTIGILICKSKKKTIVEYSLKDMNKPIGVSEYELTKLIPEKYKSSLPTIEEIEAEISEADL